MARLPATTVPATTMLGQCLQAREEAEADAMFATATGLRLRIWWLDRCPMLSQQDKARLCAYRYEQQRRKWGHRR
jgi:hypothetical protein